MDTSSPGWTLLWEFTQAAPWDAPGIAGLKQLLKWGGRIAEVDVSPVLVNASNKWTPDFPTGDAQVDAAAAAEDAQAMAHAYTYAGTVDAGEEDNFIMHVPFNLTRDSAALTLPQWVDAVPQAAPFQFRAAAALQVHLPSALVLPMGMRWGELPCFSGPDQGKGATAAWLMKNMVPAALRKQYAPACLWVPRHAQHAVHVLHAAYKGDTRAMYKGLFKAQPGRGVLHQGARLRMAAVVTAGVEQALRRLRNDARHSPVPAAALPDFVRTCEGLSSAVRACTLHARDAAVGFLAAVAAHVQREFRPLAKGPLLGHLLALDRVNGSMNAAGMQAGTPPGGFGVNWCAVWRSEEEDAPLARRAHNRAARGRGVDRFAHSARDVREAEARDSGGVGHDEVPLHHTASVGGASSASESDFDPDGEESDVSGVEDGDLDGSSSGGEGAWDDGDASSTHSADSDGGESGEGE